MTAFQDRIKHTLARVGPQDESAGGRPAPFDQVLQEFVETLTAVEPFVGAAIEKGHHPQMRTFVTWPRSRRDQRAIMLTFWWDGTTMKVLNEPSRPPFESPQALGDYLVEFLENSAFPTTLVEYRLLWQQDVYGYLRVQSPHEASPEDVSVLVRAADQQTIAKAAPQTHLNLEAIPAPMAGASEFNRATPYRYLVSGGYTLALAFCGLADGKVHLSGVVVEPNELP